MTTYTIGELANLADVTARTIRYYVAEQVLPGPNKTGRVALYNENHLARLQLVKILKDEYLPLQEIRVLLENLDHQAVLDLLQEKQVTTTPVIDQASAKTYLQTLLNPPAPETEPTTLMRHRAAKRRIPPAVEPPPVAAQPLAEAELEAVEQPVFVETTKEAPEIAPNSPSPMPVAKGEPEHTQWRRVQLNPDVELHIRETAIETTQWPKIKQLITLAHQLFSS